jgi:glycosyltransferase involved in cell wall biosynthesis
MIEPSNAEPVPGHRDEMVESPTVPRVSIVTPMYNSARHLSSTVDSVVAQTYKAWELVLCDDGSTDGTIALARRLAESDLRIKTCTGNHGGVAVARNNGLRRTDPRSEYIAFLDHDDTWELDALETLIGALDAHPECPAAHALARGTDMEGRQFDGDDLADYMRHRRQWRHGELVDVPVSSPTPFAAMIVENWVVTPGTSLIRRAALASIGELDPAVSPADDWDLNVRLARRGDLAFVDRVVLNWRRHPAAQANTARGYRWANLAVRRRALQARDNTPEQRAVALDLLLADCQRGRSATLKAIRTRQTRNALVELTFVLLYHANYYRYRPFAR